MQARKLLRDVSAVLAAERSAILGGKYDRLEEIAMRKDRLFADLPNAGVTAAALQGIGRDVARNQALLRAAIDGFKDTVARLGAMRAALDTFQAYGREGAREVVTSARPSIERKV